MPPLLPDDDADQRKVVVHAHIDRRVTIVAAEKANAATVELELFYVLRAAQTAGYEGAVGAANIPRRLHVYEIAFRDSGIGIFLCRNCDLSRYPATFIPCLFS